MRKTAMNAQASVLPTLGPFDDSRMIMIAREIAMDLRHPAKIMEDHNISADEWGTLTQHPQFARYVQRFKDEWESAANTRERVELKSLAIVEQSLQEFYERAIDPQEALPAKTEVLKTLARFANLGNGRLDGGVSGERLTVTINLGQDHQLKIERDVTPQGNAIEGDVL